MPQSVETHSADEDLDSGRLQMLLHTCRLDLGSLKREARCADGSGASLAAQVGQSKAEQRLSRMLEHLERTVGTLDAMLASVASRPSAVAKAEVLAREADHRIRNSLQAVISLMEQQAMRAEADGLRDGLLLAAARVQAVAQVHAALHAAPASYGIVPELSLDKYLNGLCAALAGAMGADGWRRSVRVEVEPLPVSPPEAQRLGLLVTELVTNALRHAFRPHQPGTVRVTGARQGDGSYKLCVADNGRGLPRDFDIRKRSSGLGLRLVNVLADQQQARLTVDGHAGARFTLVLPAPVTELGGGELDSLPIKDSLPR